MINKKIARACASCIVLVLLLINCTSCLTFQLSGISGVAGGTANTECFLGGKKVDIIAPERESWLYSNMTDEEKTVYSAAYTALSEGYDEFVLKNVDYQRTLDIYGDALTAVLHDHPEYFWFSGYVKANAEYQTGSKIGNVTVSLGTFDYWNDADLTEARRTFNTELVSLTNSVSKIAGDYERIKYVHDRIIDMTVYDEESYRLGDASDKMMEAYSNSAYGPLVEGVALCGGYAKLFEAVMHRLGYECEYITGTADGGPHAWNMIKLDGEYYHIDLTWDDPDRDDGLRLYNYFCVNDAMIEKTHTPDPEYKGLNASSTKYNYHVYESLYLVKYDFEAVKSIVTSHKLDQSISIRFANSKEKKKAMEDLINDYKFFDILDLIDKDSYSYIDSEDLYILTFIID